MRLLFFNPENDLALAANGPHYTPPASALNLARDLQELPLLWAQNDDIILLRDGTLLKASDHQLLPKNTIPNIHEILPWGWSPLAVEQIGQRLGFGGLRGVSQWLNDYRQLAGRATATQMLGQTIKHFQNTHVSKHLTGEAHTCKTLTEANYYHQHFRETIFKQPWSGSGRGLHHAHQGTLTTKDIDWINHTLHKQEYLIAEPFYTRIQDLALEFWKHHDGHVSYLGLSLFYTTPAGVYAGNLIATENEKRQRIAQYIPLEILDNVTLQLQQQLTNITHTYRGPIGVDMMIVDNIRHSSPVTSHPAYSLHPCVEINFRMTMGWVALQLLKRQPTPEPALFRINHHDGHYSIAINPAPKD